MSLSANTTNSLALSSKDQLLPSKKLKARKLFKLFGIVTTILLLLISLLPPLRSFLVDFFSQSKTTITRDSPVLSQGVTSLTSIFKSDSLQTFYADRIESLESSDNRWKSLYTKRLSKLEQDITLKEKTVATKEEFFIESDIDLSGDVIVGTDSSNTLTVHSTATFNTVATVNGQLTIDGHLVPASDDKYDLGSSSSQWRDLHLDGTANIDLAKIDGLEVSGTTKLNTVTYTWPSSDGTASQVLSTDASGTLSWSTIATGNLVDADNDTKIQVEESSDEDIIRFDTTGTERMVVDSSGNVGIGTSLPLWPLDVNGAITARNDIRLEYAFPEIKLIDSDDSSYEWRIQNAYGNNTNFQIQDITAGNKRRFVIRATGLTGIGGNDESPDAHLEVSAEGTTGGSAFMVSASDAGDGDLFVVKEDGNVGIGTTTPKQKFETNGDGLIRNTGGDSQLFVVGGTNGDGTLWLTEGGTSGAAAGASLLYEGLANRLDITTGSTPTHTVRLSILRDTGLVGIGETSPAHELDIAGSVRLGDDTSDNNELNTTSGTATTADLYWGDDLLCDVSASNCGISTALTLDGAFDNGKIVDGANSNANALQIGDGTDALEIYTSATNEISFETNGSSSIIFRPDFAAGNGDTAATHFTTGVDLGATDDVFEIGDQGQANMFVVKGDGEIGIGTNDPSGVLEVAGSTGVGLAIDMNSGQNHLTFQASGTSEWTQYVNGGDLSFFENGSADRLYLEAGGEVGIGNTSPTDKLHVTGDVLATTGFHVGADADANLIDDGSNGAASTTLYIGNETIDTTASDQRLKEDITLSTIDSLAVLNSLNVVDFNWKQNNPRRERGRMTGLIAQEVYETLPQVVRKPDNPDSVWSVEYHHIVPYLIKGVQDQQTQLAKIDNIVLDVQGEVQTSLDNSAQTDDSLASILDSQQDIQGDVLGIQDIADQTKSDLESLASYSLDLEERIAYLEDTYSDEEELTATSSASQTNPDNPDLDPSLPEDLANDLLASEIIQAGFITLDGLANTIQSNSDQPLQIQPLPSPGIELVGGLVTIDKDGNVQAKTLSVEELIITTSDKPTLGADTIPAGSDSIKITTPAITDKSHVFVTPTTKTLGTLFISQTTPGESFTVSLPNQAEEEVSFNWWLVQSN